MKIVNEERLAEFSKEAAAKYGIPGMGAVIIRNGKITQDYIQGVVDAEGHPVKEDTLYESASLTKCLFATLFLRLVDRGIVTLDEPAVAQGAPVWSDDPRFLQITPRHCLCHAPGLPGWCPKPMPFLFDPGTSYSYSGEGYFLLQHLAEVKLGKDWPEIMREEFFRPWNLPVEVVWTPEISPRISNGYDTDSKVRKIRDSLDVDKLSYEPNCAWSLYSNAHYYAEFVCHMMNEHCGLSDEMYAEMFKVQNHAAKEVDWGLGWGLTSGCAWHWGDDGGYKNFVVWDLETKDGIVVFSNCDKGMSMYMDLLAGLTEGFDYEDVREFINHAE